MQTQTIIDRNFLSDQSLSTSFSSSAVDMRDHTAVSIQVAVTRADAAGNLVFQVSDDGVNFFTEGDTVSIASASQINIVRTGLEQRYWRLSYVRTSGGAADEVSAIYTMKPNVPASSAGGGGSSSSVEVFRHSGVDENDSDKTVSILAKTVIESIYVELTTNGTTGARQLQIDFRDGDDNVVVDVRAGATQAASTTRKYLFSAGSANAGTFLDTDYLHCFMPSVLLDSGESIRIYDNNAVAASADDMIIRVNGYTIA